MNYLFRFTRSDDKLYTKLFVICNHNLFTKLVIIIENMILHTFGNRLSTKLKGFMSRKITISVHKKYYYHCQCEGNVKFKFNFQRN